MRTLLYVMSKLGPALTGTITDGAQRTVQQPDLQFDRSFVGVDRPDHSRLRRLGQPAFSPRPPAATATRTPARGNSRRTAWSVIGSP